MVAPRPSSVTVPLASSAITPRRAMPVRSTWSHGKRPAAMPIYVATKTRMMMAACTAEALRQREYHSYHSRRRDGRTPGPAAPRDSPIAASLRPAGMLYSRDMRDPDTVSAPAVLDAPYLAGLNDAQRAAVLAVDGPVLVLAGAGTGKTRVLTTRLAHILATRRAWPSQIVAVTFTNKAALEMRERLERMIGPAAEGLWLGTFHSIAARILRRHAEAVGLKPNFTILDADDQLRLVKQIAEAERIDDRGTPPRAAARRVRALEGPRPRPGQGSGGRRRRHRPWPRRCPLPALPGAARRPQRRRFRRPAVAQPDAVRDPARDPRAIPGALPLSPGRRIPGHQRRAVSVAAAAGAASPQSLLRRRRRPVDL